MPIKARTTWWAFALLSSACASAFGQCGSGIGLNDAVLTPYPPISWAGWDVATDGDYLAVAHGAATDVYRRLAGGWVLAQQVPTAYSASVSGEWLVTARDGVLLVFRLTGEQWVHWQEIPQPDGAPPYGWTVEVRGDMLVAGSDQLYVYVFDGLTGRWTMQATLPHPVEQLALGDDTVAFCNEVGAGAYQQEADGSWTPLSLSPPPTGAASVAFDGQTLLIGDPFTNGGRGEVNVYESVEGGFALAATLTVPSLQEDARLGSLLAVDEGLLAVGAPTSWFVPQPAVYMFTRSGASWTPAGRITDFPSLRGLALANGQFAAMSNSGATFFSPGISDFDGNGAPDRCDVGAGTYADADCDYTPDISPLDFEPGADCDGDGLPDTCSPFNDCDTNRVPDDCQLALGFSSDCNGNGRLDSCDLVAESGASADCNGNGVPDECDLASGTVSDCNANGMPDECECSTNMGCTLVHFSDVTAAAGLTAPNRWGYHYGGAGGATADFNNDGWQDIYFGGGANPDQLYLNNGDGTFRNETAAWGVLPGDTQGAAVADYDGNGWLDVFVGGGQYGPRSRLYRNNGDNTFTDVADAAGVLLNVNVGAAAWGDYDRDGDLDLVASNAGFTSNPNANTIFRNNGDGTFTDATIAVGVAATMRADDGCGVRLFDFDGDGWQDLLWTSRFGHPHYYVGGGGRFQERPGTFNDSQISQGSGLAVGDFDEDGDFDLCVTTAREPIPSVFRNDGAHVYARVPPPPLSPDPDWQMAAQAVDIDHDTRPDLVITTKLDGQFLYHNTGAPGGPIEFNDVSQCTSFASDISGRGMATFDYDNDGDRDVILFPHDASDSPYQGEPPVLLRNDLSGADTNWIRIFLDTSAASDIPPDGIGSVVKVRLGEGDGARTLMGFIDGGSNYLSQSELSAHFGLAGATIIDEITVEWTNGTTTILSDVPVNQTLTIAAPATACPADLDRNATVDVFDLLLFIDRWFAGDANYDNTGSTDIFDLLAYLDAWFTGC